MRKELREYILGTDNPREQKARAEELVEEGELQRFIVGDENQFYFDPKDSGEEATEMALDVLHKFQGNEQWALHDGDTQDAKIWHRAQQRLIRLFPTILEHEVDYQERLSETENS